MHDLNDSGYQEEYTYLLPTNELVAKYMSICAYNGSFSANRLLDLGIDKERMNNVLDFCYTQDLLCIGERDRISITKKGFEHYGAVFSLFHDDNQDS